MADHMLRMSLQNTIYAVLTIVCLCHPILTASPDRDESRLPRMARWTERRRRAYTPWVEPMRYEGIDSFAVWKPPMYQLSRPYFIPIYGVSGRVPMFFPPQTLNAQPVLMPDNAINKPPFQGPPYLPPKELEPPTSTEMPTTSMVIKDRFMGSEDDEDRPVWGAMPQNTGKKIPTRPTRPPATQMQQFPPLVHAIDKGGINSVMHLSVPGTQDEIVQSPIRPEVFQQRPPVSSVPVSTTAVPTSAPGPSNCVWAVISCCSTSTVAIPENCFEARGCPGPFWDKSPCSTEYSKAAVETALKYYGK